MTDMIPSDDELVSSYIDGEASPSEISRVEASTELMALTAEMRAVASLISNPVSALSPIDVDRLIDVALDASDTSANVVDLTAAAQQRWWNQPRVLVAAAAVALIALAVPVLNSITDSDGDTNFASTAFDTSASDSADGSDDSRELAAGTAESDALPQTTMAMAEAPADESDVTTEQAAPAAGLSFGGFELPPTDPGFDPLPESLEPATDIESLTAQVAGLLSDFEPIDGGPEFRSQSDIVPPACAGPLGKNLLAESESVDANSVLAVADYASVALDGDEFIVVVMRTHSDLSIGFAIDVATCSSVLALDISP